MTTHGGQPAQPDGAAQSATGRDPWPAVAAGDAVAVVSPSSFPDPERVAAAVSTLRGRGLSPLDLTQTGPPDQQVRRDRDLRADVLARALLAPDIAAVLCVEGGYGSVQVLDLLPWDLLGSAPPKPFVGYSDSTALLHELCWRAGWVTVHGPHAGELEASPADGSVSGVLAFLSDPRRWSMAAAGPVSAQPRPRPPVTVRGRLWGGNLTMLASLAGGSPGPAVPGILALEDVVEEDYRVDRCLWQLRRAGWLRDVRAVVLGSWARCPGDPVAVVTEHFRAFDDLIPVVPRFPFGHGITQAVLPLGAGVKLTDGTLALEDPGRRPARWNSGLPAHDDRRG